MDLIKKWYQDFSKRLKTYSNLLIALIQKWYHQSLHGLLAPFKKKIDSTGMMGILKGQSLFVGLSQEQLQTITKYVRLVALSPNERVQNHPDMEGHNIYILLSGNLLASKRPKADLPAGDATEYGAGEVLNILRLTNPENSVNITSVLRPATCLVVDIDALSRDSHYINISTTLLTNMAHQFSERLQHTEQVLIKTNMIAMQSIAKQFEEIRIRVRFGMFIIRMIIVLCIYTLSLRGFEIIENTFVDPVILSYSFLLLVALVIYFNMLKTQLPLSEFGFSSKDWKASAIEGTIMAFFLFLIIMLIKLSIITFVPGYQHISLFEYETGIDSSLHIVNWRGPFAMLIYVVFVPVQEFLVRGGLQGSLFSFLSGSVQHRKWVSIVISNLIFITFHSHISFAFGAMTFLPGLAWGYLYSRHRTLVGVIVSHILVGISTVFILGARSLLGG